MNKANALKLISDNIKSLGYTKKQLVQDYSSHFKGNTCLKLDIVAFGDEDVYNTATSCISVKWISSGDEKNFYKKNVKYIATPVMLLAEEKSIDVIKVKKTRGENIITLQYNQLYKYFQDNRFDLSYSNIIDAKYGFKQLTLFDAFDIFEFAEKANASILGEEFLKGLCGGKCIVDKLGINSDENYRNLTSITMHIFAAIILNHKLCSNNRIDNIHELIDKYSRIYPDYFNKDYIYSLTKDTIDNIFDSIDKNITYNSVNNDMLGHFYESTLIGENKLKKESVRKEFGIYYTPKTLSDDIINHIPIEFIDIKDRYIFDGTCGSGSLLISAYKRLNKLLPFSWDNRKKHSYLTSMLFGTDKDRFAKEVARLDLLLYSIPYGNSWNIKNIDLLKINSLSNDIYPSVIVANPPFRQIKKGEQIAIDFLNKYIKFLKPNGYIGIIMPESFLENDSSNKIIESRKRFLETFDILEIWSLPGTIFKNNYATCVIIAQKTCNLLQSVAPTKIRIVNRNKYSINDYLKYKKVDFEFFVTNKQKWLNNKNYIIDFSPIEKVITKMKNENKLLDEIVSGTHGLDVNDECNLKSLQFKKGYSKYIQNANECFKPFSIRWEKQNGYKYIKYNIDRKTYEELRKRYKGLRLRYKNRKIFESIKVVIRRNYTTGEFKCISAAIDRQKCYVSSSYYCIIPKNDNYTVEELCAVINSKVANIYVKSRSRKMSLNKDSILSLPIPKFNKKQKEEISYLVNKIEELLKEDEESLECLLKMDRLENIIYDAYKFNNEEITEINNYYKKFNRLESDSVNYQDLSKVWNCTGEVKYINISKMIFTVEFVEFEHEKIVKITNNLPGWIVRMGVCFKADISEDFFDKEIIEIMNPTPLDYTYMDNERINEYIEQNMYSCGGESNEK